MTKIKLQKIKKSIANDIPITKNIIAFSEDAAKHQNTKTFLKVFGEIDSLSVFKGSLAMEYPEVPWKALAYFRNFIDAVIHDLMKEPYKNVDWKQCYKAYNVLFNIFLNYLLLSNELLEKELVSLQKNTINNNLLSQLPPKNNVNKYIILDNLAKNLPTALQKISKYLSLSASEQESKDKKLEIRKIISFFKARIISDTNVCGEKELNAMCKGILEGVQNLVSGKKVDSANINKLITDCDSEFKKIIERAKKPENNKLEMQKDIKQKIQQFLTSTKSLHDIIVVQYTKASFTKLKSDFGQLADNAKKNQNFIKEKNFRVAILKNIILLGECINDLRKYYVQKSIINENLSFTEIRNKLVHALDTEESRKILIELINDNNDNVWLEMSNNFQNFSEQMQQIISQPLQLPKLPSLRLLADKLRTVKDGQKDNKVKDLNYVLKLMAYIEFKVDNNNLNNNKYGSILPFVIDYQLGFCGEIINLLEQIPAFYEHLNEDDLALFADVSLARGNVFHRVVDHKKLTQSKNFDDLQKDIINVVNRVKKDMLTKVVAEFKKKLDDFEQQFKNIGDHLDKSNKTDKNIVKFSLTVKKMISGCDALDKDIKRSKQDNPSISKELNDTSARLQRTSGCAKILQGKLLNMEEEISRKCAIKKTKKEIEKNVCSLKKKIVVIDKQLKNHQQNEQLKFFGSKRIPTQIRSGNGIPHVNVDSENDSLQNSNPVNTK